MNIDLKKLVKEIDDDDNFTYFNEKTKVQDCKKEIKKIEEKIKNGTFFKL